MTNLNDLLIPIFPQINDVPIVPSATRAGNGSHLIKSFNDLIGALSTSSTGSYKIIDSEYNANNGDRILVLNEQQEGVIVQLPITPITGDTISLLLHSGYAVLGNVPRFSNQEVRSVVLSTPFELIELIYVNADYGWICSKQNVLTIEDIYNQSPG